MFSNSITPDLLLIATLTKEESFPLNSSAVAPSMGFCCSSSILPVILPRPVVCAVIIQDEIKNMVRVSMTFRIKKLLQQK